MRSGIRKLVRTPPTSTAAVDSRGKPSTKMPASADVPPTSMTTASFTPANAHAPRIEFVGPEPSVSTGKRPSLSGRQQRSVVLSEVGIDGEIVAGKRLPEAVYDA